jgi:hypothetical protein
MTQLHNPLTIFKLHKTLPKKMSHIKEEAKVKFINAVIKSYRANNDFGTINFDASTYNGENVTIVYKFSDNKLPIHKIVEQVMSQWYFSNLEKNENVYFYRFINVFRSLLTELEWAETTNCLSNNSNATLKENFNQYTEYRRKLDEIDIIIAQDNFNAKEQYV